MDAYILFGFGLISDCYNISRNSRRSNSIIAIIAMFHCHRACMCNHSTGKIFLCHSYVKLASTCLTLRSFTHTHTLTQCLARLLIRSLVNRLWESKREIQMKTKIVYSNFFYINKSIHFMDCIETQSINIHPMDDAKRKK